MGLDGPFDGVRIAAAERDGVDLHRDHVARGAEPLSDRRQAGIAGKFRQGRQPADLRRAQSCRAADGARTFCHGRSRLFARIHHRVRGGRRTAGVFHHGPWQQLLQRHRADDKDQLRHHRQRGCESKPVHQSALTAPGPRISPRRWPAGSCRGTDSASWPGSPDSGFR